MPMKNVLIIHTDQQRYDSLGCTGNPYAATPNIDALADEGTLCTRHLASNCICMPSRASLLTGLYPVAHGVWDNGVALNRRDYVPYNPMRHGEQCVRQPVTAADAFARAGYRTACFGKMHLTPFRAPADYGYHESRACWRRDPEGMAAWHGPYYGFQHVDLCFTHGQFPQGHYRAWLKREHPDVFRRLSEADPEPVIPGLRDLYPAEQSLELHPTTWLADAVARWLEEERAADEPFFAFVGFPDPHHPWSPTREALEAFADSGVLEPSDPEGTGLTDYPFGGGGGAADDLTREDLRTVRRYTLAMVHQIDLAVGRICDALKDNGLWEQTAVVFTSDHGDFLGDHGFIRKGYGAAHSLLHVPCILRVPWAELPPRVDRPMSNCDVLPSLLGRTEVPVPDGVQGADVLGAGEGDDHRAFVYNSAGTPETTNYSVYDARYRYTCYPLTGRAELFDHQEDPGESRNLSGDAAYSEKCDALRHAIAGHLLRNRRPAVGRVSAW